LIKRGKNIKNITATAVQSKKVTWYADL